MLHRLRSGSTGEAHTRQRRAEAAICRGDLGDARQLVREAMAVARQSNVGFHLLDRIYGTALDAASARGELTRLRTISTEPVRRSAA